MLIDPKKTTVAFRCPSCGCGVMAPIGVFSLTADRMKLNCVCKQTAMEISKTNDDKIRLRTPCLACGKDHSFTVSTQVFFSRDIFTIPCSVTGLDICFFGHQDKVQKALEDQENTLRELVGGNRNEGYDEEDIPENADEDAVNVAKNLNDAEIYDIIKFILMELEEDGQITCGCDSKGEYDAVCLGDKVKVFCKACGRFKTYPISSVRDAERFLQIDEIHL